MKIAHRKGVQKQKRRDRELNRQKLAALGIKAPAKKAAAK